jgi:broad specificity phosphatase PhoE
MFELKIFIHLESVDRNEWKGQPDERPLSEMGRLQASHLADHLSSFGPGALLASPALRCRQSLEPLSEKTGIAIEVAPGFKDTQGYKAPDGWENPDQLQRDPLGGAESAGVAYATLLALQERYPDGRLVLCSYGDIVPALLAFLSGLGPTEMPPRNNQWGAFWNIQIDGQALSITTDDPPPGFPHSDREYFPLGRR